MSQGWPRSRAAQWARMRVIESGTRSTVRPSDPVTKSSNATQRFAAVAARDVLSAFRSPWSNLNRIAASIDAPSHDTPDHFGRTCRVRTGTLVCLSNMTKLIMKNGELMAAPIRTPSADLAGRRSTGHFTLGSAQLTRRPRAVRAASSVALITESSWAAETNPASYADGAR